MRISTGRGDDGETDLWGGRRVGKDDVRIEACGSVDELSSALGRVLALELQGDLRQSLERIQDFLFRLGSDLANPAWPVENPYLNADCTQQLEHWIERYEKDLPALKSFILPGGCPAGAALHWTRAVCRRAERRVQTLASTEPINEVAIPFLNRLGDLLFLMARWANLQAGRKESIWRQGGKST